MQFPKVSLGSFCTDFGATIHCLTLSQRDVALRRGVHVQSLRMHPRAVKKGSEVPPYLPSQSLRAVKELLPLSPYLLGYIRSRLSSLRSYSGPFSGDQLFWLCVSCRGQRRAYLMTQRESKRVLCVIMSGWPHQRFLERSTVVVAVNLPVSRSLSTCTR